MTRIFRPRQLAPVAFCAAVLVALAACGGNYPNSTFLPTTEFNRDTTSLWNTMLRWGTLVFIVVEVLLLTAIVRYRRKPNSPDPEMVHGNTTLEIAWTVLPLLILVIIAIPTVRNIHRYGGDAPGDALQVRVIGHQWWWEFQYPQYNVTTANELYLPIGRTVRFELRTADVLHSFWIPGLGGKRDLISNKTNSLWFTPDSVSENAWNGSCNEYCGSSHANMRFRAFTVAPENFESWARHQAANAVFPPPAPAADSATPTRPASNTTPNQPPPPASSGYTFPAERLGAHNIPQTPIPASVTFPEAVLAAGDAQRGFESYSRSACIGCHKIRGNPMSIGIIGPDLTHIASRHTIGGGLFPNDPRHMAHWIKNSRAMKPGSFMQTLGKGEYDPILKINVTAGALTDEQIADIVAYLRTLR
jgi:cytochrome c oxidase subunit 2